MWSLADDRKKRELVNNYLAAEILNQGGPSHDKPVEIVVNFHSTEGSLFFIKHKRESSRSSSSSSSSSAVVDDEFVNFKRRISHVLLKNILKTQGRGDAAYKEAIANLAHQVYTLNPSACFEGLVAANSKKSHNAHKSYDEIMKKLIVDFDQNTQDVDDQFEGLFPPDIQLQDLEGGMEDGDVATEAGVDE
jgi:hypothetical protein